MKSPAFQIYPADWRKDPALQMCSIAARGLWWEMICIMHEARPYGHLSAGGRPIPAAKLAQLTGLKPREAEHLLAELRANNVFSETDDGVIYSRRMVRDEATRKAWRERQDKHRDKQRDVTPTVTPPVTGLSRLSSSSSSSSSSEVVERIEERGAGENPMPPASPSAARTRKINGHPAKTPSRGTRMAPDAQCPDEWRDWACQAYGIDAQRAVREFNEFRNYWSDIPGEKGLKLRWLGTFKNRLSALRKRGEL